MTVLLDSDVLLDAALQRAAHGEDALALLDLLERRSGDGYMAWHSVSNLYYLARGPKGKGETRNFIGDLLRFVRVAPVSTRSLQRALELPISDFEDAMQVVCAEACKADVIATRNVRDYRRSPIRAATPAKLLIELR